MSRAFTRESDHADELDDAPDLALPDGVVNYVTPAGHARLRAAFEELTGSTRPPLALAAAAGDTDAARRLREVDKQVRFVARRLGAAQVVDPAAHADDRVRFGATVTVRGADDAERTWRIVGVDESDASRGWVSWRSPVASSLMGARAGDAVTLRTPRGGDEEFEVVAVRYEVDS